MSGRSWINARVFSQKSFKSSGRDRRGRTPSGLPLLECRKLGRHASRTESSDCVGLGQIIGLPPSLETDNDRSRKPLRRGCFMVLREKSFKRRSGDRLRRGLTYFPGLESAEFDRQAGGNHSLDRLRLAESVQGSPCFQLGNYGREAAVLGHQCPMMPIAQNAGNSQSKKIFDSALAAHFITKSVIDCDAYRVRRVQKRATHFPLWNKILRPSRPRRPRDDRERD